MSGTTISRRQFGQTALAAAALAGRGSAALAAADRSAIRLGAPVPSPGDDPEELARVHRKLGYRAAYCPPAELNDTDRVRAIAKAFAKHDVTIAEVGRWVNLLDADPAERKANLEKVTEGLALAEAIGARCCVDIAGSYSKEAWYGPHPENISRRFFEAAVENARKIIDAVLTQPIVLLPAEAVNAQRSIREEIDQGKGVTRHAGALHDGRQRDVVNRVDLFIVVHVIVALEDRHNIARLGEHLAHGGRIFHTVVVRHIEPLMDEDDRLPGCLAEVLRQPLQLVRRDVRVRPFEVPSAVGLTVVAETGVQDDKMKTPRVKRVAGLRCGAVGQEFLFGQ